MDGINSRAAAGLGVVEDPTHVSSHDAGDRLKTITYPDKTTASFGFDLRGRRTSVTDQNSKTTTFAYDDADRLISVTDAAQHLTQYGYDTESNLTSIIDAKGQTTTFHYTPEGWVDLTTFPSTLPESYGYDAIGNLTSKTDRKGQTILYVYDALNRLSQKKYDDSTEVDYIYDLVGKLKQVSDPTGAYGFAYDNMGRLIGTTTQYSFLPALTFRNTYNYDAASNRVGLTDAAGVSSTYGYDTLNRLGSIQSSSSGQFTFGYDALSRRTSLARPNGVSTSYGYDNLSHLLSVLHQAGATGVDGDSYTYDLAGNRLSKTDSASEQYTYDDIYQLKQVNRNGAISENYGYDNVGNRLSSLTLSPYSYDVSNRLLSTPVTTYQYDYNGNTTSKTDSSGTTGYAWDYENRLTSVTLPSGGGTVTFRYDPLGRRIQKLTPSGVTNYVYDGANIIAEYDAAGFPLAHYDQGAGVDEPLAMSRSGALAFYHADGLGSITSLTDSSGSVVQRYSTDTFGNTITAQGNVANPFRFTGREWDSEIGLYYYRARYYDPLIGRFVSEDPVGFSVGTNFYGYVDNNAANFSDPSGYCKIEVTYTTVGLFGHHAAIITSDFAGSTVTRAAAGPGIILPFDPPKNACIESTRRRSKIVADQGGYGPGSPDYEPHPPTTLVLDDQLSCVDYNRRLREFIDQVNSSGLIYQTFTRNSNSFARAALTYLGLNPPVPPVWTPGWNRPLGMKK